MIDTQVQDLFETGDGQSYGRVTSTTHASAGGVIVWANIMAIVVYALVAVAISKLASMAASSRARGLSSNAMKKPTIAPGVSTCRVT